MTIHRTDIHQTPCSDAACDVCGDDSISAVDGPHRELVTADVCGSKFVLQHDGDVREVSRQVSAGTLRYGSHVGDAGRIARLQELSERLLGLLAECAEFLEGQADVRDGADGQPMPNRAMSLLNEIDQELVGRRL